jgi:dienelactone hydrolase
MKKKLFSLLTLMICTSAITIAQTTKKEINFTTSDDLTVTADLYLTSDNSAPFIILFHQAGYSRGEYLETAPKFNKLGYNCLAVDQRSGREVNEIVNKTNAKAKDKYMKTAYTDAMPDLEAAINYVKEKYNPKKLIILGSSYSSTLSIILASKYPKKIDAALAFSPGEYFLFENRKIEEFASDIKIPIFITSAKDEEFMWKDIYNKIPSEYRNSYLPEVNGIHGSRALWEVQEGNEGYWNAVKEFLINL